MSPHQILDHTADVILRVDAPDLRGLFFDAVAGLYAVIGQLEATGPEVEHRIELHASDRAELLRDWLGEALLLFEMRGLLVRGSADWRLTSRQLETTVRLAAVDRRRSKLEREVKAVTYHELSVAPTPDGWSATVLLDI